MANETESKRENYMVSPRGYGMLGWKLVNTNTDEVVIKLSSREEIVSYARDYMWSLWHQEGQTTELVMMNRWGRFVEKNTYPRSSDPIGFG